MIFIGWLNAKRNDVGAVRSTFLMNELKKRGVFFKHIDVWNAENIMSKMKNYIKMFFTLLCTRRQLIYTSCCPYRHLPVLLLTCLLRRHCLVVDFRDAYSYDLLYGRGNDSVLYAQLVEKIIYKICDTFVVVTPGIKELYAKQFGDSQKIMLVPNGHNIPTEFLKSLPNAKEKNKLLLVYPGKYAEYYGRDKSIEYMDEIESALKKTKKNYSIEFIGTDRLTKKIFRKRNHFKFIPQEDNDKRIPYLDTIAQCQGSCQ